MYKVLIVDDEPFILDGIENIICWDELGLELAGKLLDGSEALKVLETIKAHIIITDIKMPKVSGLELIQQVRNKGLNIKFIILSGYNDFEYVKKAITLGIENYLLKPVNKEELHSTLKSTVEKIENDLYQEINQRKGMNILRENILYRWVTNNISPDELLEKSSILDINLDYNEFKVSIVKFIYSSQTGIKYNNNLSLISFATYNICNEIIGESGKGITFCDITGNVVILFMNDCHEESVINAMLSQCIKGINKYLGLDVFITSGDVQPEFDKVASSYAKALELQDYFLIMPPNSIIDVNTLHKSLQERQETITIDFEKLKSMLDTKNKEAVAGFTGAIFNQLKQSTAITRSFVQNMAAEILYYISGYIREYKKGSLEHFNVLKTKFSNTLSVKSLNDISDWVNELLVSFMEFLAMEESGASPVINQILDYIKANYAKEISLKILSDHFNINAAYLGQLFKKETGELFSDYLNRIRVDKAKELLLATDLKAGKISEKVGYTDDNYFFKTFRKITGVSPTEYRNNKKSAG